MAEKVVVPSVVVMGAVLIRAFPPNLEKDIGNSRVVVALAPDDKAVAEVNGACRTAIKRYVALAEARGNEDTSIWNEPLEPGRKPIVAGDDLDPQYDERVMDLGLAKLTASCRGLPRCFLGNQAPCQLEDVPEDHFVNLSVRPRAWLAQDGSTRGVSLNLLWLQHAGEPAGDVGGVPDDLPLVEGYGGPPAAAAAPVDAPDAAPANPADDGSGIPF